MEEWVGQLWHRLATRQADAGHRHAAVTLAEVQPAVVLLLHAGGARHRVAQAQPVRVGGKRTPWQRIAGSGLRVPLAQLDRDVLALPARVAVHDDPALNRDLYLWWAALSSCLDIRQPWVEANRAATPLALQRFPGLKPRWERLVAAELALRPLDAPLEFELNPPTPFEPNPPTPFELSLSKPGDPAPPIPPRVEDHAPVWCWLVPMPSRLSSPNPNDPGAAGHRGASGDSLPQRRRVRRQQPAPSRTPLLLASKGESLRTYADTMRMDRGTDDEDDGSARVAAEELEALTLQHSTGSVAARVRFDLDLPSASADDLPLGPGELYPEWDPARHALVPGRVRAQTYGARQPAAWQPAPALRATAGRVRRRMELQRAAPRWQHGVTDGEAIDMDAWVRSRGEAGARRDEAVYQRRVRHQRELATLLLADLSLSTDAHANDRQRVIDVIRDALYVFGTALAASGDAYAMLGFSSVRRQLRLHELKRFDEHWGAAPQARLGALKPGYYTRMGAALRAATRRLEARPERQRLLLLLTDGKPHDLDGYEGRLGMEDTRQAVLEARRAGLLPFALSIDDHAGEAMPQLFGHDGWAWVRRPDDLPQRLAALYAQLTR